jgi:hypothetical protein
MAIELSHKRVYISGPITGYEYIERYNEFERVQRSLEGWQALPVNPMKNGVPPGAPRHQHLKKDFADLTKCDCIYLLEGWERSEGCRMELQVATACGLDVVFDNPDAYALEL